MSVQHDFLTPDILGGSYLYAESASSDAVFGFVVTLTAVIDVPVLERTVGELLTRFPYFAVKVVKGDREYGFAEDTDPVKICSPASGNGRLLSVSCLHKSIFFNFHRALTDERGAMTFIRSVIFRYLSESGFDVENDGGIISAGSPVNPYEADDAFSKMDDIPASRPVWYMDAKAFSFHGICCPCPGDTQVIRIPLPKVKGQAKSYMNMTTSFVAPFFSHVLSEEYSDRISPGEYVVASIKVNLRHYFPTPSLRPFFAEVPLAYNRNIDEYPVDTVVMSQKKLLEAQLKTDALAYNAQRKISALEKVCDAPDSSAKIEAVSAMMADRASSAAYSLCNVGNIIMPESLARYVTEFYPVLPATLYPFTVTTAMLHGELTVAVTCGNGDADTLCRRFVRLLNSHDINAFISDRFSFSFMKYEP